MWYLLTRPYLCVSWELKSVPCPAYWPGLTITITLVFIVSGTGIGLVVFPYEEVWGHLSPCLTLSHYSRYRKFVLEILFIQHNFL